jgi:DNA-binding transcriptional LysR family regulator
VEGYLHVVTPDSVCEDMMTANYVDFHSRYPHISLKFTTADTEDMFRMLNQNTADLALTLDTHIYQTDFIIAKEEQVGMHFVTGTNSPYATSSPLTLAKITEYPFILTEKGMGYRRILEEALARSYREITPILELGRTDLITDILEKGVGVSFLPDFVTEKAVQQGKLTYLQVTDMETDVWKQLIRHRNKWLSRPMEILIEYIKEMEFGKNPRKEEVL